MVIISSLVITLLCLAFFAIKIHGTLKKTTWLHPYTKDNDYELQKILEGKKISIIIPAHNEDLYIADCVRSLLQNQQLPNEHLEVIVVNDQSTDQTGQILDALKEELNTPQLVVLHGKPKPEDEVWISKNWACYQGANIAKGDYFLFIDADIFLKQEAIKSALLHMNHCKADLLSFYPRKWLKCLPEWIVEPTLVLSNLAWPRFVHVSDPKRAEVFTPGWFMLFKRHAYESIGGHRSVANEVLEDIEIGKRTKKHGFRVEFCLGPKLADMRMYDSFNELWEGYTKNFYCGLEHKAFQAIATSVVLIWTFTLPYLTLLYAIIVAFINGIDLTLSIIAGLSAFAISVHILLRLKIERLLQISKAYWWAMGIGGFLLAALMIHSMIKHRSGKGYTWKGIPLPQH